MIFSEIYGAYYTTMAKIIERAIEHPLKKDELRSIVNEYAFGESILNIDSSIAEGKWQLIKKDGTTPIINAPSMPLTLLQRRWLKAISLDPRMKLFDDEIVGLEDVEPLFTQEDYYVFDKYADGDAYEDAAYIRNFRLILDAIRKKYPLKITTSNRKGRELYLVVMPECLEYSEKDDKFRLIGVGRKYGDTINLGRIISCEPYTKEYSPRANTRSNKKERVVEFELVDERNALERVLLHFAHFKKQAERLDGMKYKISVTYDKDDETEILIRILSFGPMIRVTGPDSFVSLVKDRLQKQKSCGH
ncbi:WYL domain-containing protein [Acetivibrio ethanolgignens]|uniref:WYL domain-containing protein n=1 Tax=Acetivibrio ethanolgignens TaxID=290052 RepID=A0A0V8QE37_9FIRM|nr:WYL domain-containing protein [Acetivibrio ethanolgignens]KSV58730.1 hypothetical protein ASU35_12025 [Acetivibrio ethanolgignens]